MPLYYLRPEPVGAIQWTGNNRPELERLDPKLEWLGHLGGDYRTLRFAVDEMILTLRPGDWLIRSAGGWLSALDHQTFRRIYEPASGTEATDPGPAPDEAGEPWPEAAPDDPLDLAAEREDEP